MKLNHAFYAIKTPDDSGFAVNRQIRGFETLRCPQILNGQPWRIPFAAIFECSGAHA